MVYGKGGHFVLLVDRCLWCFMVMKILKRAKQITTDSAVKMLRGQQVRTLTVNNGVEFADHKRIEKRTSINLYFTDPYVLAVW